MQDKSVETEYSNINVNKNGNCNTEKDLDESSNQENDTADVQELKDTIKKHEQKVEQLEEEIQTLEIALREHTNIAELEEMLVVVQQKDDRIEELEEALRESVRILSDRENVLHTEENRRKKIMEKVGKLEQRLLSLQTAHALRCSSCRPLVSRTQELERRLAHLVAERQKHLRDLSQMKQEALEAAISEKDAHLALLEVSGIKTARQAEEVEQLKLDRRRLMEKLKEENEEHMRLLQEYSMPDLGPPVSSIMDLCDSDDVPSNRHNGHTQQASEQIDQDSLESQN